MKPPKGDTQFLVFAQGCDTPEYCTDDFRAAKGFAEKNAKSEGHLYEVYAKIGQAVPVRTPPPVKWFHVESVGM